MDIPTILIVFGISLVFVVFMAGETTGKGLDAFGAGFLPYREAGWPRGVQEGEPIPWKLSAMTERGLPPIEREVPPDTGAEVFEIDPTDRSRRRAHRHRPRPHQPRELDPRRLTGGLSRSSGRCPAGGHRRATRDHPGCFARRPRRRDPGTSSLLPGPIVGPRSG